MREEIIKLLDQYRLKEALSQMYQRQQRIFENND